MASPRRRRGAHSLAFGLVGLGLCTRTHYEGWPMSEMTPGEPELAGWVVTDPAGNVVASGPPGVMEAASESGLSEEEDAGGSDRPGDGVEDPERADTERPR